MAPQVARRIHSTHAVELERWSAGDQCWEPLTLEYVRGDRGSLGAFDDILRRCGARWVAAEGEGSLRITVRDPYTHAIRVRREAEVGE